MGRGPESKARNEATEVTANSQRIGKVNEL